MTRRYVRREPANLPAGVEPGDDYADESTPWRGPIRTFTGLLLIVILLGITARTLIEREDAPDSGIDTNVSAALNAGLYIEGLFFAAIAVGVAIGVYIATRDGD
jgi:hypothetical protein